MSDSNFSELKAKIEYLKSERNSTTTELLKDRQNLLALESKLAELKIEQAARQSALMEKENALKEYQAILEAAEGAYEKIVSNSFKLVKAIDTEKLNLSQRLRGFKDKMIP